MNVYVTKNTFKFLNPINDPSLLQNVGAIH